MSEGICFGASAGRRRFLTAASGLALASAAGPLLAGAERPLRIAIVNYRGRTRVEDGFETYLAARRIRAEILWHDIARDKQRLPGVVEAIRAQAPDLVVTWGTTVSLGVLGPYDGVDPVRHITDIPAVFTLVADPVGARLVPAMASSGRGVTGVTHMAPVDAQLRAMRAYRPFRKLGLIYSPNEKNSRLVAARVAELGRTDGFTVAERTFPLDADGRPDGSGATGLLDALKADGVEWLYLPPDSYLTTLARDLLARAAELGVPTFASTEALVKAGALTGVVSRYERVGQFTAYKAEQILLGGRAPASIPVETLSRFSLQVNLPVARRMGLPPPLAMFDYAELLEPEG
ncbi:MAG: ABC transporter substrate-binding protein [Rhodocyclaceae bacterium]|nr:ABC transporter substrate-binding protein [Rhodocyclaceae bacterium]